MWGTILLCACLLLGCSAVDGDPSPDGGTSEAGACGPGLKPYKTACIPVLDDCPEDHAPVPGGGCRKVGVEACSVDGVPGLKGPPDWTCKRIGVKECTILGGPGIKGPPDWSCEPIGPPKICLPGWGPDRRGWCEPILPETPCPAGTMEIIGKKTCQPVGDCGGGPYGAIKTTAGTLFVNQAYVGGDADGSQAKPFPTIAAGLKAAPPGGHVAVAAGSYAGDLLIDKPLTLEGRCAQLVKVVGLGGTRAVAIQAKGTTLRGLTVTGPAMGVWIDGAADVLVEAAVVDSTGGAGVHATNAASVTLRSVLVDLAFTAGVSGESAGLTLERCTVRRSRPDAKQMAVGVISATQTGGQASLHLSDSVVLDNWGSGIVTGVFGPTGPGSSSATVERSVVMGTQRDDPADVWEVGIKTAGSPGNPVTLVLRDSLVAGNRSHNMGMGHASVTIERCTVRDSLPRTTGDSIGNGHGLSLADGTKLEIRNSRLAGHYGSNVILWKSDAEVTIERSVVEGAKANAASGWGGNGVIAYRGAGAPSTVTLRSCLVARNRTSGLYLIGTEGVVERSIIRDTLGSDSGFDGSGLVAKWDQEPARLTVRDCLVENSRYAAIQAVSSEASVERTVVRETRGRGQDDLWGCGIAAWPEGDPPITVQSDLSVSDCIVSGSTTAGILGFDSMVRVSGTLVSGTRPGLVPTLSGPERMAFGVQVYATGDKVAARLELRDSAVTDNSDHGIYIQDADANIERSVVSGTRRSDGYGLGQGVVATGGRLTVRDSHVASNRYGGIALFEATGVVERTAVNETLPENDGTDNPAMGVGIYVGPSTANPNPTEPGTLALRDSVLARNHGYGLIAWSAAAIHRCVVRDTRHADGYGDGVVGGQSQGGKPYSLDILHTLVDASSRVNLALFGGAGVLRRSVVRNGEFAVVLMGGASLDIGPDNVFEGNSENRVTFDQSLAPPPMIPLPPAP